MKMKLHWICLLTLAAGLATGIADETKNTKPQSKPAVKTKRQSSDDSKTDIIVTGSYFKQKVRRHGRITDGMSQVIVIDRTDIERSGAANLKQLLALTGAGR